MRHIKVFILCLLFLLTATGIQAQQDAKEIDIAKCDDGSILRGKFILMDGIKMAKMADDIDMLCVTDSNNITRIYKVPSMTPVCEVKQKGGSLAQVSRDGYLKTKPSPIFGIRLNPNFYNFNNEKIWTSKLSCLMANRTNNMVICRTKARSNDLVAYDMTTGNELWHNTITQNKHYPWLGYYNDKRNPDIYYLIGDSLLRLNIITGEIKSASFEGGCRAGMRGMFNDIKEPVIYPSAEWRREAVSSYYTSGENLTGICSNWLVSGDSIFVADAQNVYCFNRDLNKLWSTALPDGIGCKSHLTLDGDVLRMMGFGVAFREGKTVKNGKPFIASYNRKTGRQQGFSIIKTDRKLIGGIYVRGRAYWQDSKSFYYTNEGDTTATRIDWKPKTKRLPKPNYPDRIICDTVGVLNVGEMGLVCTDARQLVVRLYGEETYVVHDDGSSEMLDSDNVYFHDSGRLYSTNGPINPKQGEQPRHYIVTYPGSWRIQKSFPLAGYAWMDDKDNLLIALNTIVGIVNLKE